MRELVIKQIKEAIDNGDDEIIDNYGSFETIKNLPDEKLLEVFSFIGAFRG